MNTSPSSAAARKQVLATIQQLRPAEVALTVGLGKKLIAIHLVLAKPPVAGSSSKQFLLAAPTQAILSAWPEESRKFNLA